jgi:hypothetical protein
MDYMAIHNYFFETDPKKTAVFSANERLWRKILFGIPYPKFKVFEPYNP